MKFSREEVILLIVVALLFGLLFWLGTESVNRAMSGLFDG